MPRLHPRLLRQAYFINPVLTRLLPVCRDIPSAHRELRWIREHAKKVFKNSSPDNVNHHVHQFVLRRSRGEPLQYILGSEFFGDLEIKCRPGVLIPRQETAASVAHLVNLLVSSAESLPTNLRMLDLCTGSGCIPLLFNHEFYSKHRRLKVQQEISLDSVGVDISPVAINLAKENQALQLNFLKSKSSSGCLHCSSIQNMTFLQADILCTGETTDSNQPPTLPQALRARRDRSQSPLYDILISNPPYISNSNYWRTASPSVRGFEPKLALVPPPSTSSTQVIQDGDLFYHHILPAAQQVNCKVLLLEVADLDQAERVASSLLQQGIWDGIEIWRDEPGDSSQGETQTMQIKHITDDVNIPILGSGEGRSVLAYREHGTQWLGKT